MKAATHLAFAGLIGVIAGGFGAELGFLGSAALAAGSLLPDIDTTTSGLGRWVKPISSFVEKKIGHRSLTHSLLGLLLLGVVTSWLIVFSLKVWLCLVAGAFSHIILDAHNISGVPLLYPMRLEFVSVYDRGMRVAYGSSTEFSYLASFAVAALALSPLSMDGFAPWFHRALGAPYGAVEDYLNWRDEAEVWVKLKGHNLLTDEDIDGRYRVIDAFGRETLLIEDGTGKAYTAALNSADIQVRRISAWRGDEHVTSTYRLDLSGRLLSDLIYALPKGAKEVRINAAFELNDSPRVLPSVGYFQRLKVQGKKLEARSATITDLAPLAGFVIETGSAVIRAEYAPGSEALADLRVLSSVVAVKSHLLEIPDLPSLAGLVIKLGDKVVAGQLIARYVDDSKLDLSKTEVENAKQNLAEAEEQINLDLASYETRLEGLRQEIETSKEKLERLRYLVANNAEPRNKLSDAEASLKRLEQDLLLEQTNWTSKYTNLEADIRKFKVSIQKAEQQKNETLDKQWVKAPVGGLISDIRVVAVSTKGVTLELMILEETKAEVE